MGLKACGPTGLWMGLWAYGPMGLRTYAPLGLWTVGLWAYGPVGLWAYGPMVLWAYGPSGLWAYVASRFRARAHLITAFVRAQSHAIVPKTCADETVAGEGRASTLSLPVLPRTRKPYKDLNPGTGCASGGPLISASSTTKNGDAAPYRKDEIHTDYRSQRGL